MAQLTNPSEIRSWRQSPFVVGRRYRIRRDFKALRDSFRIGEILTFHRETYSRYDGYTGYFFSQSDTQQLRTWDIHDDEDLEIWRALFEALQGDDIHAA